MTLDLVVLSASGRAVLSDAGDDSETTRLVLRARAGDPEAFSALVDLHHRVARRIAAVALGSVNDADDVVQDAYVTAWRRLDRLDDPRAFRAWLLRITWRKAIDRRRSLGAWLRRVQRAPVDAAPLIDSVADGAVMADEELLRRERDRIVAQVIRSLPPRLRDPFLLCATGEHRYEDVALLLGLPLGTVKWRMSEARRVLREKLQRLGFAVDASPGAR